MAIRHLFLIPATLAFAAYAQAAHADNAYITQVGTELDSAFITQTADTQASGYFNNATILQDVASSWGVASITQGASGTGYGETASIYQNGFFDTATITQNGILDKAYIYQDAGGEFNSAQITQDINASGEYASILQTGGANGPGGNMGTIYQNGTTDQAYVNQTGDSNQATINQGLGGSSVGNYAAVAQNGSGNAATVDQLGVAKVAYVTQTGSAHIANVVQH